jgi:hypothetical protein
MKQIKLRDSLQIITKEWFDKVNGNSYFASRVYQNGKVIAYIPFQYGYGSQHEWVCREFADKRFSNIEKNSFGICKYRNREFRLFNQVELIENCRKRDCEAWGKQ